MAQSIARPHTAPLSSALPDGAICTAGSGDPGARRHRILWQVALVPRARPQEYPARKLPRRRGVCGGCGDCADGPAHAGDAGRPTGHPQGRGGVRTHGSHLSAGATCCDAGWLAGGSLDHGVFAALRLAHQSCAHPGVGLRRGGDRAPARCGPCCQRAFAAKCRLRDLHLGLHRRPEGRRDLPPRPHQPALGHEA
jgi:hypothetical protein